ncbi:MAG: ABC transporter substrate-binding protein [Myxococcales bacterium]|nr:MAG: ABC transporter substrate-binding protein [Myxococcales bacterium]
MASGPYRICHNQRQRIYLCRKEFWNLSQSLPQSLEFVVVRDDNTRALRLQAGVADLALNTIPPLLVPLFSKDKRFEVKSNSSVSTTYLGLNLQRKIFNDHRVRQAIAYGIDRALLIETKFGGRASLAKSLIPAGHWAHSDSLPDYDFDPGLARHLLAEALPDQKEQRFLRLRTSTDRFRLSIARAVAAMLERVGFSVEVWPSEAPTLFDDLGKGRFDLCILSIPEVFEPHVLSWFFDSSRIPETGNSGANRWRYRNSMVDSLFRQGVETPDLEERRAIYVHIQKLLAQDLPVVPLWHEDNVAVIRKKAGVKYKVPRDGRFSSLFYPW